MNCLKLASLYCFAAAVMIAAPAPAKNVILFIGDAGGIPTLHAASVYAYGDSQKLYIQSMPNLALSDTSAAKDWVTDSAAGMTAIVTGQKTDNGVLSEAPSAVAGQKGGPALKTVLEYAEEHGLSTGVISNMAITDATPAACYAHASSRRSTADIFGQLLDPRSGDGPDVVIGAGRKEVMTALNTDWPDLQNRLRNAKYAVLEGLDEPAPNAGRIAALFDTSEFDPAKAIQLAVGILSRNPKGYFLMFEWDMHTSKPKRGLERVIAMDNVIRQMAERTGGNTLLLFTADHSFDLRMRGGKKGDPILPEQDMPTDPAAKPKVRVEEGHTGEQVLVAAQGPGSERVHGFIRNTDLFSIMLSAYGWTPQKDSR